VIDLARPGFLWAGALLALGPLLLHLLRPVERSRKILPTSRFLTPDPKRRVRLHRTPDERTLLLLRMLLCFLLGAAFAGVGWVGAERGTATLVVVDGGVTMLDRWEETREVLAGQPDDRDVEVVIVRPTSDAVPEIERLGPGVPSEAGWAELAPTNGSGRVRLAHLVRALRTAAEGTLGYDSIAARVVTDPSWEAWAAGTEMLRERIWPGRIGLTVPAPAVGPSLDGQPVAPIAEGAPIRVELRAPPPLREPFARALAALGATVDTSTTDFTGPGAPAEPTGPNARSLAATRTEITLSVGPDPEGWDGLWLASTSEAEPAGAPPATGGTSPPGEPSAPSTDAFLLLDGRTFAGAGPAPGGTPAAGATVSLLRVGGRPAAAARRTEAGCRVVIPLAPDAPITGSADLLLVLEGALETGCDVLPEPPGAEAAFRRLLEGAAASPTVATAAIRDTGVGRPLGRWILALALLVALAETWTSQRIEKRRHGLD
jgi:hypothetical protein